jgi:hypothetical protein
VNRFLLFVLLLCSTWTTAHAQSNSSSKPSLQIHEQAGNAVVLDDNFEYAILDYGVGQIQVRSGNDEKSFSPEVLWVKFRIANRSEHLIQRPRYIASRLTALRVMDNWGNSYSLRRPEAADVGGNWHGASLPITDWDKGRETYKPGESSLDLRIIHTRDFVEGITELRIYLEHQFSSGKNYYFGIAEPMGRRTNLLQDQPEPDSAQLQIKVTTEMLSTQLPKHKR